MVEMEGKLDKVKVPGCLSAPRRALTRPCTDTRVCESVCACVHRACPLCVRCTGLGLSLFLPLWPPVPAPYLPQGAHAACLRESPMKWGSALVCPSHHLWGEGVLRVLPRDGLGGGGEGERRGSIPEPAAPALGSPALAFCSGAPHCAPSYSESERGLAPQAQTGPEQNSGRPSAVPTSVAWLLRGGEGCPWRQRECGPFHPP